MNILALDTSTEYCSVAVWRDGAVTARDVHAGQSHSERLLGMIDEALAAAGLALKAIDVVAYGAGPGTFTGLRIGCGVAQGLAYALDRPVVGIGTLLALAMASGAPRAICCLDARMGEVYFAAYDCTASGWTAVHEPALYAPHAVPAVPGTGWTGCGSGFLAHGEVLRARYGAALSAVLPDAHPRAEEIATLAVEACRQGRAVAPEQAVPDYLRDKVALKTDERPT